MVENDVHFVVITIDIFVKLISLSQSVETLRILLNVGLFSGNFYSISELLVSGILFVYVI